jgi:hypothetical protein
MPRYRTFPHGRPLVSFARRYTLCDPYRPHVGQENRTKGDLPPRGCAFRPERLPDLRPRREEGDLRPGAAL